MIKKSKKNNCTYYANKAGQLHRVDGPAFISKNGEEWRINGTLHRLDGPAITMYAGLYIGYQAWYKNGQKHRLDGPARIFKDGSCEWWIEDNQINCKTNEEFLRIVKMKGLL
jgi:hypothetical protein